MSETSYPLKATLKSGGGYDAPWLTVDGTDPVDLKNKLDAIAEAGVHESLIEAANLLKAANNAAPLATGGQEAQAPQQQAAPAQQSPWGGGQQQQSAPPSGRQQNRYGGEQHPEGKACHCGKVLEKKTTQNGKGKWQCPDWRWNNGNPNDHAMEWMNQR